MKNVYGEMFEHLENDESVALAITVESKGSTPRKVGSKMLVFEDGSTFATIGGGSPEAAVISACKTALKSGESTMVHYDLTQSDTSISTPICGGSGSVMICVVRPEAIRVVDSAVKVEESGKEILLAFEISGGKSLLSSIDPGEGEGAAPVCSESWETLGFPERGKQGRPGVEALLEGTDNDDGRFFSESEDFGQTYAERVRPEGSVYFLGGGHVTYATEAAARIADFSTVVVDDRLEFANNERFPEARCLVLPEYEGLDKIQIHPNDYIVIATRGHLYDRICLQWALTTPAGYIGMIGSKRKIGLIFDTLREQGISQEQLDAVHSPIGLPIGGHTPGDIAISIVAELVKTRAENSND
ncbi:MAG: XdhC family protein [Coriobacteriales bacterium]|jgi:xanthine dehydrogenase accessory factor